MDIVIKNNDDAEGGIYEYQNGEKGLPRDRSLPEIQNTIGKPSAPIMPRGEHMRTIPHESLKGQLMGLQPNLDMRQNRNISKYQSQVQR